MRWVDDQAARYTNVTEFENSARVTGCWTIGQPNGRIVCYTKTSDHGLQVIVRQTDASWFLSFSAPDPNAEVFDWVNYDAQTLNQIPPGQRFNSTYTLTNSVVLDSEGPKFAPHVCLACHGGQVTSNGVTGSTLLPLDPGLVKNTVVTIDGNYYGGDPSQLRTVNRVVMTYISLSRRSKISHGNLRGRSARGYFSGRSELRAAKLDGRDLNLQHGGQAILHDVSPGDTEQSRFHKSRELLWKQRAGLHHRLPDAFHAAYRSSLYNAVEQRYR